MKLVYLHFGCRDGLKKFAKQLSTKKVYILQNEQVLVAEFDRKEIELAIQLFEAQVIIAQPE